jgi:hypothetical protein
MRDGKILGNKLVLDTGNPLLPLLSNKVRDPEDIKRFKEKQLPKLQEDVSRVENGLLIADNINNLLERFQKQDKEGISGFVKDWSPFHIYDIAARGFKSVVPAARDTFVDENGNEIKFSEISVPIAKL